MAVRKQIFHGCQKYSLTLSARTDKKRIQEATKALKGIYPFEVEKNCIAIERTSRKGFYDVYVSRTKIERPRHTARLIICILFIAAAACAVTSALFFHAQRKNKELVTQKEAEKQNAEKLRIQKEKEETLSVLRKKYLEAMSRRHQKIYPRIKLIYSAVLANSTVENLFIENDSFSVEVTASDALKILKNFEENPAFSSVRMNRTTVAEKKETVTYTGNFYSFIKEADSSLPADKKIDFYSRELDVLNNRTRRQKQAQLSEYITDIRRLLHQSGCREQYIQLRGNAKSAQIEFLISSSGSAILNFIKDIQNSESSLFDIQQLRIRNSGRQDSIQTTICFDSQIELKESGRDTAVCLHENEIDVSEISRIFYKPPVPRPAVRQQAQTESVRQKEPASKKLKRLLYIGLAKSKGTTVIIAKDEAMNAIYNLPLVESETSADCCISNGSCYIARIKNEQYEVCK